MPDVIRSFGEGGTARISEGAIDRARQFDAASKTTCALHVSEAFDSPSDSLRPQLAKGSVRDGGCMQQKSLLRSHSMKSVSLSRTALRVFL